MSSSPTSAKGLHRPVCGSFGSRCGSRHPRGGGGTFDKRPFVRTIRYYLESDLSLHSLAEKLKISPHHLSQILNQKLGKTFYDYINEQRIETAKRLLVTQPGKSITSIAFESGYNSKNSFYNAFKRHVGMKPTDYRRHRLGSH